MRISSAPVLHAYVKLPLGPGKNLCNASQKPAGVFKHRRHLQRQQEYSREDQAWVFDLDAPRSLSRGLPPDEQGFPNPLPLAAMVSADRAEAIRVDVGRIDTETTAGLFRS